MKSNAAQLEQMRYALYKTEFQLNALTRTVNRINERTRAMQLTSNQHKVHFDSHHYAASPINEDVFARPIQTSTLKRPKSCISPITTDV